ncbi:MAG TPA: ATP-binding cassette domain-containing protein [Conexibacter sp.]|nr:ATP-binding cassette domain-containing protein [Conexibacter sp.]
MTTARAALRLTNVRKSFVGVAALKGVDLEVRAGEVHALLGENGAGKSTLMAIAAGSLQPDEGSVEIAGAPLTHASPTEAQALGLGLVYQHPAVLEDLTVTENMALAVPAQLRPALGPAADAWARERLAAIDAELDVRLRGAELTPAERQLVEIAKALALEPKVLILDEPTAALNATEVERLFARVKAIRERGTAIVYISHRIPEVVAIADRLTVLRNGAMRGTREVAGVSEEEIVNLILGRELETVFPAKRSGPPAAALLELRGLSGAAFDDVTLDVRPGEILGFAGAEGNGQREALRALAGLEPHAGDLLLNGRAVRLGDPRRAQAAGIHLVPGDRQREGLLTSLSVGENAAASSLDDYAAGGLVRRRGERATVAAKLDEMAVKAPSLDTDVMTLSGGNQQKVVFARALLADPTILLCDEPTQGVDPGARVEIYRLLRSLADDGKAVVVLSSDAAELEGLCDRVAVFSRGHVVATLEGEEVTEEKITGTAISSTTARRERATAPASAPAKGGAGARRFSGRLFGGRFLSGDLAPGAVILAAIVLLGAYTASQSSSYLTEINIQSVLVLATALILVSLGQLTVLLTAGIDLAVGPLMALTVVVLSFRLGDTQSTGSLVLGIVLVLAIGIAVGVLHGLLIRKARISPIIATLATSIAILGLAQLLRPNPDGVIRIAFADTLQKSVGFLPIAFVVALLLALLCEFGLRRTRFGVGLRAVGSGEASAHRVGVRVTPTVIGGYALCSLFTVLAGMMLAAQVGIGDANVGGAYTLSSVTAVVLGGASIYGGRGSYVTAALGAILVTQITNAVTFLSLGQAWEYWLPGALVLIAAALFARVRSRGGRLAGMQAAAT